MNSPSIQVSSSGTIVYNSGDPILPLILPSPPLGDPPTEQYTLTTVKIGQGTVYLTSAGPYDPGTIVTLTAVPDAGWEFSSWSGYLLGSTNAVETLTMTADRWVQAVFTESQPPSEQYTLTVAVSGQGSVNLNPPGPYTPGTVVTLTAVPDAGWEFSSWSGYLLGSTNAVETLTMTADRWVQAVFTESQPPTEQYTLTAVVSGQGSVNLNPTGPYDPGTIVTLTAVPAPGWEFSSWSGYLLGSTNAVETLTMTADRWVQAVFTESQPPPPGEDIQVLRFESSHNLGSNMANGFYVGGITDMYFCWPWHSAVINDMHTTNPGSKVIVYYDFMNIGSGGSLFDIAVQNNWILQNEQGEYIYAQTFPTNKVVDRGNLGYRQYVADWLREQIQSGFDGIFADNAIQIYPPTAWTISERPVNPRTSQLYTDQEWFDETKGFIDYIKSEVPEAIMVSNGMLFNGRSFYRDQALWQSYLATANIDVVFVEGMFNNFGTMYSETDWKKSVDLIVWLQNNYLNNPSKAIVIWSQAASIPAEFDRDEMARFIFTSSLLGISRTGQNYIAPHGNMESLSTQDLYSIQLGIPTEDYHIIQGTNVYERQFTKVLVLVNPTSSPDTINLGGSFMDMEGNIVDSITLQGFNGVILTPTTTS